MRKTLLYVVILALLGFAVYYFLIGSNTESAFNPAEAGFTIKDTASVGKLYIATGNGEAILAQRTDSGWIVNKQGESRHYMALRSTVNLVLSTLASQEALYPVTKNAYDNVVRSLSTDGTKVEVYGRDGSKMKVFYVGGASVNNTGTNMLLDGAKRPFVVRVAGFSGYLTSRYSTEMRYWRDRNIFKIPAEEVKSISVQYAGKPVNSFVLTREHDSVLTMTGDPAITKNMGAFNKRRANIYLGYFANVNCEGYLNGVDDMDTTIKSAPRQSTIDVTGMHGQHQHMDIYWMALNHRSKNQSVSDPNVPDNFDADRLYAVINNTKDTVMIQQYAFRDIFHKAYEFFQNDVPQSQKPVKEETPKNVMMHKDVK